MISTQDSYLARVPSRPLLLRGNNGGGEGGKCRLQSDGRLIELEMAGYGESRSDEGRRLPLKRSDVKLTLNESQSTIERKRKGIKRGTRLVREMLVFNEMCVERVRKLRDPFKFNVTTKLENI